MPEETGKMIAIATAADALVIDPGAACCVTLCPTLKAAVGQHQSQAITRIVLDLSQAKRIDSSFVGLIVGWMGRKSDLPPANVQLFRPSLEILRVLETMGVLHFFEVIDQLPTDIGAWKEIPVRIENTDALSDLIIDAHENLMEADPRNVDTFEPVVRGLRQRKAQDRKAE